MGIFPLLTVSQGDISIAGQLHFLLPAQEKGLRKKTGLLDTENMLFHNPANTLLRFFTASSHPRRVPTGRSGAKRVS